MKNYGFLYCAIFYHMDYYIELFFYDIVIYYIILCRIIFD